MDDEGGLQTSLTASDGGAVANIQFVMGEIRQRLLQASLIPAGVALRSEEDRALVVIQSINRKILPAEIPAQTSSRLIHWSL